VQRLYIDPWTVTVFVVHPMGSSRTCCEGSYCTMALLLPDDGILAGATDHRLYQFVTHEAATIASVTLIIAVDMNHIESYHDSTHFLNSCMF
jgi:hypothetical protein